MSTLLYTFILHRLLSGLRNGLIYREGQRAAGALYWIVGGMAVCVGIAYAQMRYTTPWPTLYSSDLVVLIRVLMVVSVGVSLVAIAPYLRPKENTTPDLHLLTLAEQSLLAGAYAVAGIEGLLAAVCAVYPAVVLQKIAVNLTNGLPWNHHGTDDPTGDTFGLPSVGIEVARTGFYFRLVAALASIAVFYIISNLYR